MPDPYANITEADPDVLNVLVDALELRAAEDQQREMREAYLSRVKFPESAHVLDVGCGTGAVSRVLASWPSVGEVTAVDPSPIFLAKARELATEISNLSFQEGDARSLPFDDGSFDVAVFHTCLCHIPGPEQALEEAFRVLRSRGHLAIFDGDYATTTLATGDSDPLQACADAAMAALVHDRWLARRLPSLVQAAGFKVNRFDSHGYVQTSDPGYMLTIADRGADALVAMGRFTAEMAEALKNEARRRAENGEFYGFIAYVSLIAQKP